MAPDEPLLQALATLPPGPYGVGVSGGADSVALLHLLRYQRGDVGAHVVHLDHQTRSGGSGGDAEFVRELSRRWGLACTIARLDEVLPRMRDVPRNKSARFRAARLAIFRQVVAGQGLRGVLLAHHADDQAETILHRLLRGARAPYLAGMSRESRVKGLLIIRPLLEVRSASLRGYLSSVGQTWREDVSNSSGEYLRNRLRGVLSEHEPLRVPLLDLERSIRVLRGWVREAAPRLDERFPARTLQGLPPVLAAESVRRWLTARGLPADAVDPGTVARVVEMATDAATPPRQALAGAVQIKRSGGWIFAEDRG